MPPKIKRLSYHVWMAPADTPAAELDALTDDELHYHHVVVSNGDQLRAELEGNKLKVGGRDNPMHMTNLWLWAAMARTGIHDLNFRDFKLRCVSYDPDQERAEPHDKEDAELDDLDAHPTEASSS